VSAVKGNIDPLNGWIEMQPVGLTAGMDPTRPMILFREKDGTTVLPVWLSSLDAGMVLTQHQRQSVNQCPHDVSLQVLKKLGIQPEACYFTEVKGHQQFVQIKFTGSKKLEVMKFRADSAISFCLQAKVKFFASREYMEKCREIEAELKTVGRGPRSGADRNPYTYLN
jgi:hypothetical protein